ncbi:MAG: hypothetical protein E6Q43_01230 [Dokdonella sp.]|jgi:hypothetical protein|nr:MAG: hypothetical protein E6Q43_01230 [Dokdonella sp.]
MPSLNLTAASRAAGVGRSTIVRALKSGRLSATTNEQGERVIDTSELSRVFGPLKDSGYPNEQAVDSHDKGHDDGMAALLRDQLRQSQEREARLLALLETTQQVLQAEQQARRDLETRLLPAPPPRPAPAGKGRVWILLALLLAALAFAGWHWQEIQQTSAAYFRY